MAITQTARLKLQKQAAGDASWATGLNDGFDNADARIMSTGAGSPVGVAEGFYVGAFYFQTTPPTIWICTVAGTPGTWVQVSLVNGGDVLAALVLANNVALQAKESGGTARELLKMDASNAVQLGTAARDIVINILTAATGLGLKIGGGALKKIWHEDNDGTGSLLDADMVDGLHKTSLLTFETSTPLFFESAETAVPASQVLAAASHGLGSVPRLATVHLRCKTTEFSYAVGDEVIVASGDFNPVTPWVSSTQCGIVYDSVLRVMTKTGGTVNNITPANWRYIFRAWK